MACKAAKCKKTCYFSMNLPREETLRLINNLFSRNRISVSIDSYVALVRDKTNNITMSVASNDPII